MTKEITKEVEDLVENLVETQEKLDKEKARPLAEQMAKLTGRDVDEFLKYDEEALKEMVNIAEDKTIKEEEAETPEPVAEEPAAEPEVEVESKGAVETPEEPEPVVEEKDKVSIIEKEGGTITMTEDGWNDYQESMNTDWIDKDVRWVTQQKRSKEE